MIVFTVKVSTTTFPRTLTKHRLTITQQKKTEILKAMRTRERKVCVFSLVCVRVCVCDAASPPPLVPRFSKRTYSLCP